MLTTFYKIVAVYASQPTGVQVEADVRIIEDGVTIESAAWQSISLPTLDSQTFDADLKAAINAAAVTLTGQYGRGAPDQVLYTPITLAT